MRFAYFLLALLITLAALETSAERNSRSLRRRDEPAPCFLNYAVGESHDYVMHADGSYEQRAVDVQDKMRVESQRYGLHMDVRLTLLAKAVEDESGEPLLHFQMDVLSASRDDPDGRFNREGHTLEKNNEAFAKKMSLFPLYFTQRCNGDIMAMSYPPFDSQVVVNLKTKFLKLVSRKLSADLRAAHTVEHEDHLGTHVQRYEYGHKRMPEVDKARDVLVVRHAHDSTHKHNMGTMGAQYVRRMPVHSREAHTAVYKRGVLHQARRELQFNFHDASHSDSLWATPPAAEAFERDTGAAIASGPVQSAAFRGKGRAWLEHTGVVSKAAVKRSVLDEAQAALTGDAASVSAFAEALHGTPYAQRVGAHATLSMELDAARSPPLELPTFDDEVRRVLKVKDGDDPHPHFSATVELLLQHKPAETLEQVSRYMSIEHVQKMPRWLTQEVLNALANARVSDAEDLLVAIILDELLPVAVRSDALFATSHINNPSETLVHAVYALMPTLERVQTLEKEEAIEVADFAKKMRAEWAATAAYKHTVNLDAELAQDGAERAGTERVAVEITPLERQAALAYGALAFTLRVRGDEEAQERAIAMRADLYERMILARTIGHQNLFTLAARNAGDLKEEPRVLDVLAELLRRHASADDTTAAAADAAADEAVDESVARKRTASARIAGIARWFQHDIEAEGEAGSRKRQRTSCNPLPSDFENYEECITNLTNQGSGPVVGEFNIEGYLEQLRNLVFQIGGGCLPWDQQPVPVDDGGYVDATRWLTEPLNCAYEQRYRAKAPAVIEGQDPANEHHVQFHKSWEFGKKPLGAIMEAMLDINPKYALENSNGATYQKHKLFAGGIVEGILFENVIHIVSTYVSLDFKTLFENGRTNTQECGSAEFSVYFALRQRVFYSTTGTTVMGCIPAYQTCNPIFKPFGYTDDSINYEMLFFHKKWAAPFDLGSFDIEVSIRAFGKGTLYISPPMFFFATEGGLAMNAYAEPEGVAKIQAGGRVVWDQGYNETERHTLAAELLHVLVGHAELELALEITLVNMSLPAATNFNFNTMMGGVRVTFRTTILAMKITFKLTISGILGLAGPYQGTLWEWNPVPVYEQDLMKSAACEFCPGPCGNNAVCNYANGQCQCAVGWDGPRCTIPCPEAPMTCLDAQIGVHCRASAGSSRMRCTCDEGSWGDDCSKECLPNRANPCSRHGQCVEGVCYCDPYYYGPMCRENCPPAQGKDHNQPLEERCKNGYCFWDGAHAKCECNPGFIGVNCDKACPSTTDARQFMCSLRGECAEINGKAICLCQLGFYGDKCEEIDFDGSGRALHYPGSAESVYDTELAAGLFTADESIGITTMAWVNLEALPDVDATILRWKYGAIVVGTDGTIKGCDGANPPHCVDAGARKLALDEWTHVSLVWERTTLEGALTLVLYVQGGSDELFSYTGPVVPVESNHLVIGKNYKGAVDTFAAISRHADASDFALYRHKVLSGDTPGMIIYGLSDAGRGTTEYLERPFLYGTLGAEITWVDSEVLTSGATVNSEAPYSFQIFAGGNRTGALQRREYDAPFDGRYVQGGRLEFMVKKKGSNACNVRAWMLTNFTGDADGKIPLLASDSDTVQIFSDQYAKLEMSGPAIQALEAGMNTIEFELVNPTGECGGGAENAVDIEDSFFTIDTKASDGFIEFTGVSAGYMEVPNSIVIDGDYAIELWLMRKFSSNGIGLVMALSKAQAGEAFAYEDESTAGLTGNTPFMFHERGGAQGITFEYEHLNGMGNASSPKQQVRLTNYQPPNVTPESGRIVPELGRWTHVVLSMKVEGGYCKHKLFFDGYNSLDEPTGVTPPMAETLNAGNPWSPCSSGVPKIKGFGDAAYSAYTIRFGARAEIALNDIIFWDENRHDQFLLRREMYALRNWADAAQTNRWLSAWNFEEKDLLVFTSYGKAKQDGTAVEGVFRGLIYGAQHKWKRCPGPTHPAPERVCSNDLTAERGRCTRDQSQGDGFATICECFYGYTSLECELECPGGAENPCTGHGRCRTYNDTVCECNEGWAGDACQYVCPGYNAPDNVPKRECSGFGRCRMINAASSNIAGSLSVQLSNAQRANTTNPNQQISAAAECICDANSGRFGQYCQFGQGAALTDGGCSFCVMPNAYCHQTENVCLCQPGTYMVGQRCIGAAGSLQVSLLLLLAMIVVSIFAAAL